MAFLFLFIDGLGTGERDASKNPCAHPGIRHLACFSGDPAGSACGCKPIDANLGMPGLPQSATGQTALFTGINAAECIGRHLAGFPNRELRGILKEHSLLKRMCEMGRKTVFYNAYRPIFFSLPEEKKWKLSATTVITLAAGLSFRTLTDLGDGKALYHDLTNESLIQRGFDIPLFTVEQAAHILAGALREHDFILYEYFLTDHAGHSQDIGSAAAEIRKLDRWTDRLLDGIRPEDTVLLTSDHGNIEDLSVKTHTRNPAMMRIWGPGRDFLENRIRSIQDVTPAVIEWMGAVSA
ncbi:alkaline phosphatase family protein [bacterium]|nr:alkaline phosphatase family protein [bacterium]